VYAYDESSGTALFTCPSSEQADYTVTVCPWSMYWNVRVISLIQDSVRSVFEGGENIVLAFVLLDQRGW
jgi:hypothetical protein